MKIIGGVVLAGVIVILWFGFHQWLQLPQILKEGNKEELIMREETRHFEDEHLGYAKREFRFDEWAGTVRDSSMVRFHSNIDLAAMDIEGWDLWHIEKPRKYPHFGRYYYQRQGDEKIKLSINIVECNSILEAHEQILLALSNVTMINPPVEPPSDWQFGDVIKLGYWARDNVFVSGIYPSDKELPSDEAIRKVHETIDAELLSEWKVSHLEENVPVIVRFSPIVAQVRKGDDVEIDVVVESLEDKKELQYRFFIRGGRLSRRDGAYLYHAEKIGTHTLQLFVKNRQGHTAMSECIVTVIE